MIKVVSCPDCGQRTVVELPETATNIDEVHSSLRYDNRATYQKCYSEFSVRYQ